MSTKTKKRKFYRAVFKIVLLADEPIHHMDLETVKYNMTDGHMSGVFTRESMDEVPAEKMAKLLIEQGSDPEFLGLDEDGKDIE